jgi:transcription regulator MmyB-like protein/helix-turn-helix protein
VAGVAGTSDPADVRAEIRAFLSTRRAKISPAQAGLPVYRGDHRRVSGLRREEVAVLAGISIEYYTRFERGNATGVSESVIDAITHALQLDDAERTHLLHLIRTAGRTRRPRRRPAPQQVRPAVQRIIDSMTGTPALVLNGRLDILTANALGHALYSPVYADPVRPANNARFLFLDPHATEFFRDWDKVASDTVALLRAEAGRDPYDRGLSDLIGELSTRSDQFRVRWAAHNVRIHTTGVKLIHHPVVGDLDLPFESFPIPADPSQSLLTYTTEPDSPSHDALSLLASWATSPAHDSQPAPHDNGQQSPRQDQGYNSRSGSASRPDDA